MFFLNKRTKHSAHNSKCNDIAKSIHVKINLPEGCSVLFRWPNHLAHSNPTATAVSAAPSAWSARPAAVGLAAAEPADAEPADAEPAAAEPATQVAAAAAAEVQAAAAAVASWAGRPGCRAAKDPGKYVTC